MEAELARISQRIRLWREESGLTLQDLARRSDLATSTIQKVETAQMVPSVAVMLKIARGLGRRAAELVHEGGDDLDVIHQRGRERRPIGVENKLMLERLSGDLPESSLEMWRATLHPGISSGRDAIQYGGEEIIVCERGTLTVCVDDCDHVLRAGDSLHFKASLPHLWRNEHESVCRFTVTGTLPIRFREAMESRVAGLST